MPYILNQFRSVFYPSKLIFVPSQKKIDICESFSLLIAYLPPQKHNMQIIIIDLFLEISLDVFLRDLYTINYSFKKYIYIKF